MAGTDPSQLDELMALDYARWLESANKPASRAPDFEALLGFLQGTFGAKKLSEVAAAPLFKGAVAKHGQEG